jgi:nitrogen fixation protein FixH
MKINWGWGIAIFFSCFVLFMSSMVYRAFQQDFQLEHEDYYSEELKYQDKIDRQVRTAALKEKVTFNLDSNDLRIEFPGNLKTIEGEIFFYRPSDKNKDFMLPLRVNNGEQHVALDKFSKGLYKVRMTWEAGGVKYFNEETIII